MSAYKPGTGCRGSDAVRLYELGKSVQCHVPALGVCRHSIKWGAGKLRFFLFPRQNWRKREEGRWWRRRREQSRGRIRLQEMFLLSRSHTTFIRQRAARKTGGVAAQYNPQRNIMRSTAGLHTLQDISSHLPHKGNFRPYSEPLSKWDQMITRLGYAKLYSLSQSCFGVESNAAF